MSLVNRVLTCPKQDAVEVIEKPYPKITDGFLLVKVIVAPVCDESRAYKLHKFSFYEKPDGLGHEGVGEVVETRSDSKFKVGDRVAMFPGLYCNECYVCEHYGYTSLCPFWRDFAAIEEVNNSESGGYGFSQYRIVPDYAAHKIPDNISWDHAATANCALGCTFSPLFDRGVTADDIVLVSGLGMLGLGTIVCAKYLGASVIAAGRNEYRTRLARELGADWIVNPEDPDVHDQIRQICGRKLGVDFSVVCASYPLYLRLAVETVRRMGKVHFLHFLSSAFKTKQELILDLSNDVMWRHVEYDGSQDTNKYHRDALFNMIARVGEKIDKMVTHRYPMSRAKEAFEVQLSRKCGKIFLYPQQ